MTQDASCPRPVAVVVPTWNGRSMLEHCLTALDAQARPPDLILVVDNGSSDGTEQSVRESWPQVRVLALPTNHGFAGGCNRGVAALPPEFDVALLNNDAQPDREWLAALVHARDSAPTNVGIVASKILDAQGRLETTGDFLTKWGSVVQRGRGELDVGQWDSECEIFSACAGASLYRREIFSSVGGFDERFFAYYEDVDLSFRARSAGWLVLLAPGAVVRHRGGGTSARIPGFKRFHATRNLWWLLTKNLPTGMLAPVLARTAVLQLSWLVGAMRHRELGIALSAQRDALRLAPQLRRERRASSFLPSAEVRRFLRPATTSR